MKDPGPDNFTKRVNPLNMVIGRFLLLVIRAYQLLLSPWLGPRCRYLPTCSEYAREALELHGLRYGVWLAIRRIGRCHPWGASGYDPVPEAGAVTEHRDGHGECRGH